MVRYDVHWFCGTIGIEGVRIFQKLVDSGSQRGTQKLVTSGVIGVVGRPRRVEGEGNEGKGEEREKVLVCLFKEGDVSSN